ncbi:MAG: lipid-binding SYLF domain-containing protein [Gammaproteobacteria bacterium]|nr:lipid-binding SYLF domain-containing protein [Gammaproteobacteria bacterium]
MERHPLKRFLVSLAVLFLFASLFAVPSSAQQVTAEDLAQRVTKAQFTFRDFERDPRMTWFRQNVRYAKGLLIMPVLVRGGFFFGGSGGRGVLLAQDAAGTWSNPAFYDVGSASFGLQFGAAGGQVILMIMTDRGLRRFLNDKFQLGADASISVGPEGIGAKAEIFDIFSFSRVKGIFAGLTIEGGVVVVNRADNQTYYGQTKISPRDILLRRKYKNPQADDLIRVLTKASR